MALFKRNDKKTIAELEQYYANQDKSKGGAMAWFMAILSLLITIAVISLLFFGGRWVYQTITGDDEQDTTTSTTESNNTLNQESNSNSGSTDNTTSTDSGATTGVVSDEAASTSTSNQGTAGASTSVPTTGPLPNTGPDLDL